MRLSRAALSSTVAWAISSGLTIIVGCESSDSTSPTAEGRAGAGEAGEAPEGNGGTTSGTESGGMPPTDSGGQAGEAGAAGSAPLNEDARLVIADQDAATLYVYSVPDLRQLAVLPDVTFADHPGFLALSDGRVLFTDSATQELVCLQTLGEEPRIVGRAHLASPAVHLAVDPAHQYAAVSGAAATAEGADAFTLVRLRDFFHKPVAIPTGEPGVLLGGDPLHLYHRNDAPTQLEAYLFQDLWQGTVQLKGSRAIGAAPHGEAIAHAGGKIFVAADDGINVVEAEQEQLSDVRQISYDVSGKSGGRAYYARLSVDGKYLYSYLRDSGPNFDWAWKDWISDAYVVDVASESAQRIEVGKGLVYRLADSEKYAMFVQYHPDGDFAHFLDTDAASDTFQTLVGKVPLETMSKTPTGPDADPWSSEAFRLAGMVPSGRWGFVTHGGDGKVSMIDTTTMEVAGQIELPTPLNYGGYLVGVEPGSMGQDTVGR